MVKDAERRGSTADLVRRLVPREAMASLMVRSNAQAAWHLLGHGLALVAAGCLVALAQGGWLVGPAMFLMGIVMTHLFAPQHECAHFSAFRSRRLNSVVAWCCGAVIMVPQIHFRYEHHHHHTFTNLRQQDPELIPMPASFGAYLLYLSGIPYWWSSWSGIARRSAGLLTEEERGFIPMRERSRVVWEARALALIYSLLVAMVLAGWRAPLFYWLLPLLLGQPVMRFIRMTEHVGRPHVADPLQNTRTTRVSGPWRLLAWNMNYHAEHHLLPSVPYHALPRFHGLLQGRIPVRHGYLAGHREILAHLRGRAAVVPGDLPS
jgi:fatty acid desaturase